MIIKTGIIAAAGAGTRMYPVVLGFPKELLPIIDKPAIQLVIEEFIDSGLNKIIIVTGDNAQPLRRQYDFSKLPPRGKYKKLDDFVDKLSGIDLIFEDQRGPYGNGTPLLVARPYISQGEKFIYAYGDDIIKAEVPFTLRLIEKYRHTGALVAGTQEIEWKDVVLYGMAQIEDGSDERRMVDVVEKPSLEEARSNLAMFGRFLLSTDIIQILSDIPLGKANELWLTDAVREYIKRGGYVVAEPVRDGQWLTIGDPERYLSTVLEYALSDTKLRLSLEPRLRLLLDK